MTESVLLQGTNIATTMSTTRDKTVLRLLYHHFLSVSVCLSLSLSLSLHFIGHFSRWTWVSWYYWS